MLGVCLADWKSRTQNLQGKQFPFSLNPLSISRKLWGFFTSGIKGQDLLIFFLSFKEIRGLHSS